MKDTLIIEHLRKGDEAAFKYIYECHYVLLCRFANQILNDAALSEEVVDDAIFYLWEHRREIEITYSVRAYLMPSCSASSRSGGSLSPTEKPFLDI